MTSQRSHLHLDQRPSERSVNFGFLAILSIVLVNAAAGGAALVFWATVLGPQIASELATSAAGSFKFFGFGVLAALASAGVVQITEYFYERANKLGMDSLLRGVWAGVGVYFHCMAILAAALGILSFAWGALQGIATLEATNGGLAKQSAMSFLISAFG